jgi:DNA-binding transcriptional LysR family regulator
MDFIDLKIFKKLYITHNLTQVSRELYLSQPTLSYRLNKLRDELDAKLYHYDGQFHFTESGRKLYQFCERALKEHDGFIRELDNRNIIRIALSAVARYLFLEKIYAVFEESRAFPIINFTTSDEAVTELLEDRAMLSVVGGLKSEPDSHEFYTKELQSETLVLVYNERLIDDIGRIPILNDEVDSGLHEMVLEYLEQFESTKIAGEIGNALEKISLVNDHPVGAFVPEYFFAEIRDRFPKIRGSEQHRFSRELYLLCQKKYLSNPTVEKIIRTLE